MVLTTFVVVVLHLGVKPTGSILLCGLIQTIFEIAILLGEHGITLSYESLLIKFLKLNFYWSLLLITHFKFI